MVLVPKVVTMSQADATSKLEAAGLVADHKTVVSTTDQEGIVQSQSHEGGQSVPKGSKVTINVTMKPVQKAVPKVVGETKDSATATLTAAGFTQISVVEEVTSVKANEGKVLSQSPAQGTLAAVTDTITITVGKAPGT